MEPVAAGTLRQIIKSNPPISSIYLSFRAFALDFFAWKLIIRFALMLFYPAVTSILSYQPNHVEISTLTRCTECLPIGQKWSPKPLNSPSPWEKPHFEHTQRMIFTREGFYFWIGRGTLWREESRFLNPPAHELTRGWGGIYPNHTGVNTFSEEKKWGGRHLFGQKNDGAWTFYRKRMTGPRLFMEWIRTILIKSIEKYLCRLAFQDYEMGGLRLFLEKEMTGHNPFQEMKMRRLPLFSEKKMTGPRLFWGLKISYFPLCRTINFAPSLRTTPLFFTSYFCLFMELHA